MNNSIFKDWISPRLHFPLLVLLSVCIGFSSGVPTSISSYMVSGFSTSSGHASMCSYAYMAGMAVGFTLLDALRGFLSMKKLMLGCSLLIVFLNFVILSSESVELDILATFLIGGLRILGILVVVVNMMPILMPNGSQRYVLYGVYYPISLLVSPISGMLMVLMTDKFGWQFSFHICNLMLFGAIICMLLFLKDIAPKRRILPYKFDWIGLFIASGWMLSFAFFWSYGRYMDWLDSVEIRYALGASLVLALVLVIRTNNLKNKLFNIQLLRYRNVRWGLVFIFVYCIFYSTTNLLTSWMNAAFHNNAVENARINLYPVLGYILGAVLGMAYFRRYSNFKVMLLASLACYMLSSTMMYFLISTEVSEFQLAIPMILRGMAIILSYMTIGLYVAVDIPMKDFVNVPKILIFVRSFLGPTLFGGLYSWLAYGTQLDMLNRLASNADRLDSMFQLRYGNAPENAQALSTFSTQATLSAVKINFGWSCIGGIVLFLFIVLFPIHKRVDRKIFKWGKRKNQEDVAEIAAV